MKYGYGRVSTIDQSFDRQIDEFRQQQCDRVFLEKRSGGDLDERIELNRCLNSLHNGDTLVVCSFDRLARSLKDLIWIAGEVARKGANLISLKEAIDTSTPGGKFQFHLFGAFAEFEKDLIRSRTQEGLRAAKARGRQGGRPRVKRNQVEAAWKLYRSGQPVKELSRVFAIGEATLYREFAKMR